MLCVSVSVKERAAAEAVAIAVSCFSCCRCRLFTAGIALSGNLRACACSVCDCVSVCFSSRGRETGGAPVAAVSLTDSNALPPSIAV